MLEDTIAAIATPLGEGGLAVLRISGKQSLEVADRCFRGSGKNPKLLAQAASHTVHHGKVIFQGRVIDEVMVAVMKAPRTFTREDVVEISCHGGILPAKMILDALLGSGARLALPGEFTRRAFLSGRIDLTQAEAVADLIHARTELALAAANEQLAGKLSEKIGRVRDELMHILAHVEAHIDFPDEDIAPDTRTQMLARFDHSLKFIQELLETASEGKILRRGIRAAIIGRPNAGKSSLLNQLLGQDRAIVSAIPGTTRDTIEETANIRGIPVVFIDTAGIRESEDVLEKEGIKRTRDTLQKVELVLWVLDASQPFSEADHQWMEELSGKKLIVVLNKIDLPKRISLPSPMPSEVVPISCLTGEGIEKLKEAIKAKVWSGQIHAGMAEAMINSRHQDALQRALTSLRQAKEALAGNASVELVALDLRIAVHAVGEVVGKTTTEDLLDAIFSQFCIGK